MQIPIVIGYHDLFDDLTTFHIWGTVCMNQAFMEMSEAGFKEALERSRRSMEKNTMVSPETSPDGLASSPHQSHGKYGTMLNARGLEEIDRKENERRNRKFEHKTGTKFTEAYRTGPIDIDNVRIRSKRIVDFSNGNSSFFIGKVPPDGYGGGDLNEDVAVEFTQQQLDNYGPIKERTEFKSKVEESIYRARKDLFKKTGEIY